MIRNNLKIQDTFEDQLNQFQSLLLGVKLAQISSIILIAFSLVLAYINREHILVVLSLLIGALSFVFCMYQFLSLKGIKQNSYTQRSLVDSISKFTRYISNRKKCEMYFIAFWALTLIPSAATYMGSNLFAILGSISFIAVGSFFGGLAFKEVDRQILTLETVMKKELDTFS